MSLPKFGSLFGSKKKAKKPDVIEGEEDESVKQNSKNPEDSDQITDLK